MMYFKLHLLLFLLTFIDFSFTAERKGSFYYNFDPPNFSPLQRRYKRGIDDDSDDIEDAFRLPKDVEVLEDSIDHQYYIMEIKVNRSDLMKDYYIDVPAMLEKPGTVGNRSHSSLSNSYRRAVAAKIQFDFPFYGHRMKNLTIATGGFAYIGDQWHSWLAATQYIAPLMANFDTHGENATIMYADDGEKFVMEWRNLQLREQRSDGFFTFQASLHKNGDIWFVYKDVPIPVTNISDSHHPVKIGMSDAYLFHHSVHNPLAPISQPPSIKRVIYEYHRIEVKPLFIVSNTIVLLKAQPTCIQYQSCEECSNATLKHFNCSWCHSKAKHGGPFCSDQAGLHRRRQHWIEGNCKDNGKVTYCSADEDFNEIDEEDDIRDASGKVRVTASPSEPDEVVAWDREKKIKVPQVAKDSQDVLGRSNSGFVSIFVVVVGVIMLASWASYAYFNPHTPSGQLLIRYRPSRWHMPSSHVRYSASVHM
ncbi:tumor endothelial marker 3 [Loa loa]|uniref:Tumor endothelial marker 3 n=1 Tax=Loa loa TaxID=7209 RepID=A0A1I7VUQ3_LOALO|nr:tumor endothelial marker 3 [Loa loa]EFO20573.2 tumor endothelial marker 3 [Loa loa]